MKFLKLILNTALVITIIGIIFTFIGFVLGGNINNINNKFVSIGNDDSNRVIHTDELTSFDTIDIDCNLDVALIKSNVNKIELNYNDKFGEVLYSVSNNTLSIKQDNANTVGVHFNISGFNKNNNPNFIKIYINESSILKDININTSDSNVYLNNLNSDFAVINCDYGNLNIENSNFTKIEVTMNDGNLKVDDINVLGEFEVKNNYGNINIVDANIDTLISRLQDGNFKISNTTSRFLDIENNYGDVMCSNLSNKGIIVNSNDGNIDLDGSFLGNVNLNNKYGNIDVSFKEDENSYNYSLNNKFGTVSIGDNKFEGTFTKDNKSKNNIKINCNDGDVVLKFHN